MAPRLSSQAQKAAGRDGFIFFGLKVYFVPSTGKYQCQGLKNTYMYKPLGKEYSFCVFCGKGIMQKSQSAIHTAH